MESKNTTMFVGEELIDCLSDKNYDEIINFKKVFLLNNEIEHYFIEYSFCCHFSEKCAELINIHIKEIISLPKLTAITLSCNFDDDLLKLKNLLQDVDPVLLEKLQILKKINKIDRKPKVLSFSLN